MCHALGSSGNDKRYAAPQRFRVQPGVELTGKVDPEARVAAVHPSVMTKGMYLADYPFADALRWLHAVARAKYPTQSLLEGLRRLGRDTVKVFVASQAGQVVRSMTMGPRDALLRMPKMWKITDPSHTVLASEPGPNEVLFKVQGFPGWIDCGLIGTLEQVVISRDAEPEIDVCLYGPETGEFSVRYR